MFAMHEQGQNGQDARQQAFADFYEIVRGATQTIHLDELSDEALNELIHQIASEIVQPDLRAPTCRDPIGDSSKRFDRGEAS